MEKWSCWMLYTLFCSRALGIDMFEGGAEAALSASTS